MPVLFAFGSHVLHNPTAALFASFGSFAQVLFVEFGGSRLARVQAQLGLIVVGAVLIVIGTLASGTLWLGAVVMAVVAFGVLFAGVVSSVLAGAGTSMVLCLILSISIPGAPSTIPDRLLGWGIASVAALIAITVLWPTKSEDPLRAPAARACRAVAAQLRGEGTSASEAIDALHRAFLATPYRPTGLSTSARTLVRLVDELNLLGVILASSPEQLAPDAVYRAAADLLERSADLLEGSPGSLRAAEQALTDALADLEHRAGESLPDTVHPSEILTALEPGFRSAEISFVISLIARNVATAAAADRRGWWERLLGHQPDSINGAWRSAVERASAHVEWHSVWLHNSVRGAAGLALAVLVADVSGVSHSFWVVLGTLSVLRSNALNTGQTIARGVLGTTVGFAVGSVVLTVVGTDTRVLWILLPIAVLLAGVAPELIGFATGQAAFTVALLILFNITAPAGWELGLVRLEDVALGCAVSLVVGLLFWPRGAAATLRFALARAYMDSAHFLDAAVHYAAARCAPTLPAAADAGAAGAADAARAAGTAGAAGAADGAGTTGIAGTAAAAGTAGAAGVADGAGTVGVDAVTPGEAEGRAAASARRLDDSLRTYLAERGPKPTPLAELMTLVTGIAALRIAASAILDLWQTDPGREGPGDRTTARAELRRRSEAVTGWFELLGERVAADQPAPPPLTTDRSADHTLIEAIRRDLTGPAAPTGVRVIWTADHLDATRRIQPTLIAAASQRPARLHPIPPTPDPAGAT
ncbi:FUSC family protein [Cryptosporangium sp. NPDC048952]|uniref:FUSC family protein n=1 Tax=Cryptosporangium sp. NPDC048952 TaxID=3363961 RepID=UPI003711CBE9